MRAALVVAALVAVASAAGCRSSVCEPGATQACVCADGASGAQVCAPDASRWEECRCAAVAAPAPAPPGGAAPAPPAPVAAPAGDPGQARAAALATGLLAAWDAGRYEPLGSDFSAEMRTKLSPAVQRDGHAVTKGMFGDLRSLELAEVVDLPGLKVYRFRGSFSKTEGRPDLRPEIRIVFDGDGKVSGFWCRPWSPVML